MIYKNPVEGAAFSHYEIHPCHYVDEEKTVIEQCWNGETPDFWSIYGRYSEESEGVGVECLVDRKTEELALKTLEQMIGPLNCFIVRSSHGDFVVRAHSGDVVAFQENSDEESTLRNYREIVNFNISEYALFYNRRPQEGDEIDILDLGYTRHHYGQEIYEEPCQEWREEVKELRKQAQ